MLRSACLSVFRAARTPSYEVARVYCEDSKYCATLCLADGIDSCRGSSRQQQRLQNYYLSRFCPGSKSARPYSGSDLSSGGVSTKVPRGKSRAHWKNREHFCLSVVAVIHYKHSERKSPAACHRHRSRSLAMCLIFRHSNRKLGVCPNARSLH